MFSFAMSTQQASRFDRFGTWSGWSYLRNRQAKLLEFKAECLLTTIVENVHSVSHFKTCFKHETFDALQYAADFGTISKKSLTLFRPGFNFLNLLL